ncbi:MAG: helix-turn-helix transcriptional regulator [Leptolyngbyaceae cyanobacterium SM2_3_12]|nr:helix-turn-helix transcriptional regulator [Leptolyngbyaceae cyanobacterium SM2_3_12]
MPMPHTSNGLANVTSNAVKYDCPVHLVLSYIGSKWAILILRELFQGNRRTNEFLSALPGISTKTLTARLRELESYGLVKRTVFPEVPPRVEYSLTSKGKEIQPIMAAFSQVGQRWQVHSPSGSPVTTYGPRSR